jgi:hypothetical protein
MRRSRAVQQAAAASATRREKGHDHEVVLDGTNLRVRFCDLHRAKRPLRNHFADEGADTQVHLQVRAHLRSGDYVAYDVLAPAHAYAMMLRTAPPPRSEEERASIATFARAIVHDTLLQHAACATPSSLPRVRVYLRGLIRRLAIEPSRHGGGDPPGGDPPLDEASRARVRASAVSYSPPPPRRMGAAAAAGEHGGGEHGGGEHGGGEHGEREDKGAAPVASCPSCPTCPICLEAFAAADRVVRGGQACAHLFHAACLDTWLAQRGHCPVCRQRAGVREKEDEQIGTRRRPVLRTN